MQNLEQYYDLMSKHSLFKGVKRENYPTFLEDCEAKLIHFEAGDNIKTILDQRPGRVMGCVLSGLVQVFKNDVWGNQPILDINMSNYLIGYYDVFSNADLADINVRATKGGEILFLNADIIESPPDFVDTKNVVRVQHNLIEILAESNWKLLKKIDIVSAKTLKEKILRLLSFEAVMHGSDRFEVPFNRQGFADYIYVDRSALSRELGRMKEEGLIDYDHNTFTLLAPGKELLKANNN